MSKPLLIVLLIQVLFGCIAVQHAPSTAHQMCPAADTGDWKVAQEVPVGSVEMLSIVSPDLRPPFAEYKVQLIWFTASNGHVLLCRAMTSATGDPSPRGCGSSSWEFLRRGGKWVVAEDGEQIVFCH